MHGRVTGWLRRQQGCMEERAPRQGSAVELWCRGLWRGSAGEERGVPFIAAEGYGGDKDVVGSSGRDWGSMSVASNRRSRPGRSAVGRGGDGVWARSR